MSDLFREGNSFPRATLEENFELQGTDKVHGQISEHFWGLMLMHTDPKSEADLDCQFVTLRTR